MSETTPAPSSLAPPTTPPTTPSGLRLLAGPHLSWPQRGQAARAARIVLANLGAASGAHVPVIGRFAEPAGWGFAAPDQAFMAGVGGFSTRDGAALAADSPVPTLYGAAEALALDLRTRLGAMAGKDGQTRLSEVETELEATGGAAALALFRAASRTVSQVDSAEVDAMHAVGMSEREVAELFVAATTGAASETGRRQARRERRRQVDAARTGGA